MAHNEMHKSGRKGPEINVIGIVKMMKLKILSLKDNSPYLSIIKCVIFKFTNIVFYFNFSLFVLNFI